MSEPHDRSFVKEINQLGGKIEILYWKPDDSYYFEIPPRRAVTKYKYPRRCNVRFAVQGETTLGGGDLKPYDENSACITYLYVQDELPEGQRKELMENLLSILEEDARKAGYSEIFTLTDEDESVFYLRHGYAEVSAKDEKRLVSLFGAQVIEVRTMQKKL